MKQRYTHIELLALRHECQEPSVKSFFTTYRSYNAYSDLQPGFGSFGFPGYHIHNQSRFPVKYASGPRSENYACLPRETFYRSSGSGPELDGNTVRAEISVSKGDVALESFQLVKIPQSFGDLPPGSRIIKVRPGIPVPLNAIPISLAEISGEQCYKGEILHEKKKAGPNTKAPSSKNKWDVTSETPRQDGVAYFATANEIISPDTQLSGHKYYPAYDQNYFAPEAGGSGMAPVPGRDSRNGVGTKVGPETIASSETVVSSETKFRYAKFFEPYIKKFSKKNIFHDDRGQATAQSAAAAPSAPSAPIAPVTSNESDSATEYSSDSSNVQIQLPV